MWKKLNFRQKCLLVHAQQRPNFEAWYKVKMMPVFAFYSTCVFWDKIFFAFNSTCVASKFESMSHIHFMITISTHFAFCGPGIPKSKYAVFATKVPMNLPLNSMFSETINILPIWIKCQTSVERYFQQLWILVAGPPPLQVKKAQSPRYGFEYILNQGGQVNEYAMSTGYAKTY